MPTDAKLPGLARHNDLIYRRFSSSNRLDTLRHIAYRFCMATDWRLPEGDTMKAKITTRTTTCRCGCHGTDPWHRRAYTREVVDFTPIEPIINHGDTVRPTVTGRGFARFPWGLAAVVRTVPSYEGRLLTVADWHLEG